MTAKSQKLYFLLQRAAHKTRIFSDNLLLNELGITAAQVAVLMIIQSSKEVTQREIARQLEQNESAITAMVQRLINNGFIKKKKNKKDGRIWVLEVTQKGEKVLKQGAKVFAEVNKTLDKAVAPNSMEELAESLESIGKLIDLKK